LYDIYGNVWEWAQDWYGEYPTASVTDPRGPSSGSYRVLRGGSWFYKAEYCRSSIRIIFKPDSRIIFIGFRLALSPE
jgi:formylglycine-generating enzyme required for sulfatase activity